MVNRYKNYFFKLKHSVVKVKSSLKMDACLNLLGVRHVLGGPFIGMLYTNTSYGSAYYPKILGTYEKELSHLWTFKNISGFQLVVDIGCAEGYYLAGIAHILTKKSVTPSTRFLGYDISHEALEEAKRILDLNNVQNYELKPSGYQSDLVNIPTPSLLICDTEGDERIILDLNNIRSLMKMHILVEVHDEPGKRYTLDLLVNRFLSSHKITLYCFQERTLSDFPQLKWPTISKNLKKELMDEGRKYGKKWLFMEPL
jgi:SAM-dependent methyltransferase